MNALAPRVLVTAAGGWVGTPTVTELLMRGLRVRALLRRDDHRAARMRAAGAEVVIGPLNDLGTLEAAMRDVQRAILIIPITPAALDIGVTFAAAAASRDSLEVVVTLSQWLADPASPSVHTRRAWLTDRVMSWLPGTGSVVLEPGFFAANYMEALPAAALTGVFAVPFGSGFNAPPSNEDIAAVAAAILADPGPHLGRRYRPTGPVLLDPSQMAQIIASVLGRRVTHRDVAFSTFARYAKVAGFDDFAIGQTRWYAEEAARGAFAVGAPTTVVPDLLGRPADSFETITRRAAAHLPPWRSIAGARRAAGLLVGGAVARRQSTTEYHAAYDQRNGEHRHLSLDSERWQQSHPNHSPQSAPTGEGAATRA